MIAAARGKWARCCDNKVGQVGAHSSALPHLRSLFRYEDGPCRVCAVAHRIAATDVAATDVAATDRCDRCGSLFDALL